MTDHTAAASDRPSDRGFPVTLPVTSWGANGDGRSVLLLHGLTSAAGVWWRIAGALAARGHRVTAPDLRGHGAAPRTARYELDDFASDVLEPTPPDGGWDLVVGHSLGGSIAVAAAARRTGWAKTLLLVDPALQRSTERIDAFVRAALAEVATADAAAYRLANPLWHAEDAHQKVLAARAVSPSVIEQALVDTPTWNVVDLIGLIESPVLILGADPGRGGASVGPELGAELTARFENVLFETVDGAGHSIHRDAPDTVIRAATDLLDSLD